MAATSEASVANPTKTNSKKRKVEDVKQTSKAAQEVQQYPASAKVIVNKQGEKHKACRTQQTGQTGYGLYEFQPEEQVYYQHHDGSQEWHLGRIAMKNGYREPSYGKKEWIWIVRLAKGDRCPMDKFGYMQFSGHTLIPAVLAKFD